jgi:beta-N-acetylhexosaminidase
MLAARPLHRRGSPRASGEPRISRRTLSVLCGGALALAACTASDDGRGQAVAPEEQGDEPGSAGPGPGDRPEEAGGYTERAVPPFEELPPRVSPPPVPPTPDQVHEWITTLDTSGMVGQLLMLRVFGGDVDEADPRNEALYGVATPREVIETYRPGGVILFRTDAGQDTGNLESPEQVRAFTDDLREVAEDVGPPLVVGIDQEGGAVDRIGHFGTPYPSARDLEGDLELAATHAEVTAKELAALGVDVNFAPVADVDTEGANPIIGDRAFSDDPEAVADYVITQLDAYEGTGVVAGLKHFPGHGDTTEDSHLTLPRVDLDLEELRERELVPFARAIEHGAEAIMTAHLELPEVSGPDVPASMSPVVVNDLLRGELGFDGVIVTDSLEMAGARHQRPDDRVALHALLAGHDLLVLPPEPEASVELLQRGLETEQLDHRRVEESVRRLLGLKATLRGQLDARPGHDVVGDGPDISDE